MERRDQQPALSVTQGRLVTHLTNGPFVGSIDDLARKSGTQERYLWVAIAELAERQLVQASRAKSGELRLAITRAGREAGANLRHKYARAQRSGFVKFS
jgi:hypothetical protein